MKKYLSVIPLILLVCIVVGCQDKAAMAELEQVKAQAALEEQNKEIVLKFYAELDNGNIDNIIELFAPNLLWYSPSNSPEPMSREDARGFFEMVFSAFPKWQHKIEDIVASGDKVIVRAIDKSTHEGEFQGIPATGNKVEFGVIIFCHLKDGKIIEIREEMDMLGFMEQLGMELKLKEAGK